MNVLTEFSQMADRLDRRRAEMGHQTPGEGRASVLPTPFTWKDPATLPPRPWLYGFHLLRRQVAVTVAPGGVGKSSLTIVEALAMTSSRALLGDRPTAPLRVWVLNLEDPRDELERRIVAAMLHHRVRPEDVEGRLFVDSGRERPLCMAVMTRNGARILRPAMDALEAQLRARRIDVLIVDPFVSSHQVAENDNGAIDLVAKEWAALADRCNCSVELVHHTRKLNGEDGTTESGRGATSLLAAARSGRVLNRMSDEMKKEAGVAEDPATYFSVVRDKANLAPPGKRVWRRMASVELGNGDSVGVAEAWEWPDTFEGLTVHDLIAVQRAIDGIFPRYSDQAGHAWAGHIVARVLDMDPAQDRKRIKRMIETWIDSGALRKVDVPDETRRPRPCLEVGEWANA